MPTGPKEKDDEDTDSARYEDSVQSMYEVDEKKDKEKEGEDTEKED